MNRCPLCRAGVVLLTAVLTASPALAAGGRGFGPGSRPGLFSSLGELLASLLPPFAAAPDSRGSNGPRSRPAPSGSIMDPNGLAAGACSGDRGSIMDPNGCPAASQAGDASDSGSIMDPNG